MAVFSRVSCTRTCEQLETGRFIPRGAAGQYDFEIMDMRTSLFITVYSRVLGLLRPVRGLAVVLTLANWPWRLCHSWIPS